jgi:hypothetical protein
LRRLTFQLRCHPAGRAGKPGHHPRQLLGGLAQPWRVPVPGGRPELPSHDPAGGPGTSDQSSPGWRRHPRRPPEAPPR